MEISNVLTSDNIFPHNRVNDFSNDKERVNKFKELLEQNINSNEYHRLSEKADKPIDKKLMDVCIEMESIFVSRMLKEMRNTIPKEKFIDGGFAEKIFEDMLYDDYALNLSKTSNLGLANMLYSELSRI